MGTNSIKQAGDSKMSNKAISYPSISALLIAFLSAAPACAQDSKWTYDLSMNLWFSDTAVTTDTPRGQVDANLSFSDAIQDLDFAFMGTAEARNGRWGIIGDLLYFNLTADGPTPNGLFFSEVAAGTQDHRTQRCRRLPRP